MDLESQAAGIGALADSTRRALYDYVSAQGGPVGREEAARALGIAAHNVNFHLDRLADQGLLDVEYQRLSGRSGPGAGRPSKLYRRASREFSVSLPPRRYDLVGDILAGAIVRAGEGQPLEMALRDSAHGEGLTLGSSPEVAQHPTSLEGLAEVLTSQGYEPRVAADTVVLANCPFDSLAHKYTALVCGLNQAYVQVVVDGMECPGVAAVLEPAEGRCCVTARTRGADVE